MLSEKKIAANHANALRSTGPKTEAGKAASSRNATRHGLAGKQVVIGGEDPNAYEALRRDLIDAYQPANAAEETLVDEIAQGFWRLQRARALEAESFKLCCAGADPIIGFGSGQVDFDRLRRYMTSIERAYHRAIQQLEKTQGLRLKRGGFVSQKSATPDKLDDLDLGPRPHFSTLPERLPDDLPVHFNRDSPRLNSQPAEQSGYAQPARHGPRFPIYGDVDGLTPFTQRHTI